MGVYNKTIITNAGINAIAQAIAESQTMAFKTAKTSSYAIPDGTNIRAMTSLRDIVQSVELPTPTVYNSNTVQVYARFSNTNIATEYYINTIGVYASLAGGAEFLFAVLTAITPDRQPVFDENSPTAFIYNILMQISDAANVVFAVNDTGTASIADINRLQAQINERVITIGGDVSNTIVSTPAESTDDYPVPAAGDSVGVIVGKIAKFFADIRNPFSGASGDASGSAGVVPSPAAGDEGKFLRGDSTWAAPADMVESFTSSDVADGSASSWTSVNALASGETNGSIFGKISMMFKNIRYLYKVLGTTDISALGNGTVTGAISTLNANKAGTSLATTSANGLLRKLNNNSAQYLRSDGTWQTPPDTNTWRGIQNNLTSTSTSDSLSAAQGKALNDNKIANTSLFNMRNWTVGPGNQSSLSNANSGTRSGFYSVQSTAANWPTIEWGSMLVLEKDGTGVLSSNNWVYQFAIIGKTKKIYMRTAINSTSWTGWTEII